MDLFPDEHELSRATDPPTSRQAASELNVGEAMKLAYEILKAHEGLTSNELDQIAGKPQGGIRKRLNDLRKVGFSRNGPPKVCTVTGKSGQTWYLGSTPSELIEQAGRQMDGWDEFWAAYPRKTAKRDAFKAYCRVKPTREVLAQMMRALGVQKYQWMKGGKDWLRYVPHAATWLNGRRWEDEFSGGAAVSPKDYAKQMAEFRAKHGVPEEELAKSAQMLREWRARRGP